MGLIVYMNIMWVRMAQSV